MQLHDWKRWPMALVLFAAILPTQAQADGDLRTVALTGQQAPGTADGVSFFDLDAFDFANTGDIAFQAFVDGPGVNAANFIGIWSESQGALGLVAREGDQAPGVPDGLVFSNLAFPVIDEQGRSTFQSELSGFQTIDEAIWEGVWSETASGLMNLAATQSEVEGLPAGFNWGLFSEEIQSTSKGFGINATTGLNGLGSFQTAGTLMLDKGFQLVSRSLDQAPGHSDGVVFISFNPNGFGNDPVDFNDVGDTVFVGQLGQQNSGSAVPNGVFSNRNGGLALIVSEGEPAPGVEGDVSFVSFRHDLMEISNAGEIVFYANVEGDGITPGFNSSGIWSDAGSSQLQLIVQNKDAAPGFQEGVQFATLGRPSPGEPGQVYFTATVEGGGIDLLDFVGGLWLSENGGDPTPVFIDGDQAPGLPTGITLDGIGSPVVNALGQYMIRAGLEGVGISDSNNGGIWAKSLDDVLSLVVQVGDEIDVNDDPLIEDLRTIATIGFGAFAPQLNDRGEIAFHATFTDGTSGIFVSKAVAIPEPSALALSLLGIASFIGCSLRLSNHRFRFKVRIDAGH